MVRRRSRLVVLFLFLCLAAFGLGSAVAGEDGKINLNTAGVDELMTLHRIGQVTAERIVAYREQNGPFKSVDELVAVQGIGTKTLEGFREKVTVGNGAVEAGKDQAAKPKPKS